MPVTAIFVVLAAINCAKLTVVVPIVSALVTASVAAPVNKLKLPTRVSPVPAAFVPAAKSDSSTLPSVPATVPSPKPVIAGLGTIVIVIVAVVLSPSPSVIR